MRPDARQADPAGGRSGKLLSPARRRRCIDHIRRMMPVSERRLCRVLGQHLSTQRKAPCGADDEAALTEDIIALAQQYGRYGYRRVTALLRGGVACEPQAGRAYLASRGAQSAAKVAEARAAVAERRIMYPAATRVSRPCLVLRFRRRADPRWSQIPDPVDHR